MVRRPAGGGFGRDAVWRRECWAMHALLGMCDRKKREEENMVMLMYGYLNMN